jgi:hypothetical protein
LLQQIGEGGMGVVYMAEQTEPVRRRVALMIIKPGMDSAQVIARFEAERQALALMDHQNFAKVLDAGTTESGRPYFVMELVKGVPITRKDEAVEACPPSPSYKLRQFGRKHKAVLATAAAFAGLLLAGVAASTWLAITGFGHQNSSDRTNPARLVNSSAARWSCAGVSWGSSITTPWCPCAFSAIAPPARRESDCSGRRWRFTRACSGKNTVRRC